ncbi:ABC transporter substrate-binding protein [Ferroacidibacillus organovorans]|uniref:ABC transporter substrate-binding protein n=1 Tax=Ferroacidibacillus organovorans TaxID=1765683 RepID=A0A101XR25_9BACL|nr:ABC transporter substrate-binding protein [Ferroacidibacillus organovorans]
MKGGSNVLKKRWVYSVAALLTLSMMGVAQDSLAASSSNQQPPLIMVPGQGGQFQENFSPFSTSALQGTLGLIYQPLFYFNPSGQTVPLLGQSFVWSDHAKVLTVNLKHNVKWSNGTPMTSTDVVFSFDLLKKFPQLDGSQIWKVISGVRAKGPFQVQFTFQTPNSAYAYYILGTTYIVPQRVWKNVSDPTKSLNLHPMGTGPYILVSFTPEMYQFMANPVYWNGAPKVKRVDFPAYSGNESTTLALVQGKIDWTGLFIPHIDQVYSNRSPYNQYWFSDFGGANMIYTNLQNPLLKQLPVREAISLAINRQKVSQLGEYGYEPPATPTGYALPPAAKAWTDPKLPTQFQYNPARAIKILEQAGFKKNAQGVFVSKNGQPLSFTLDVVSGWTDWDADCSIVASELSSIGIKVQVQQLAFGAYYQNLSTGHFQLGMSWSGSGPTPFYMYQSLFQPNGSGNWDHWNNAVTTKALYNYEHTSNVKKQQQDVYVLEDAMVKSLPYIPLVYGVGWNEYSTKNFVGWPNAANPYAQGSPWVSPSNGIILSQLRPR